ncbi:hypothetical protein LINPERHAP2_LOCUS11013 [Linum perenne]
MPKVAGLQVSRTALGGVQPCSPNLLLLGMALP